MQQGQNTAQAATTEKTSRSIHVHVRKMLLIASGGRCQFLGCNRYLFEHALTLQEGNFSNNAHIKPFSPDGPRGDGEEESDPHLLNSFENLMLLCLDCHHLIDESPDDYPILISSLDSIH